MNSPNSTFNGSPGVTTGFLLKLGFIAFIIRLAAVVVAVFCYSGFLVADDTRGVYYPLARVLAEGKPYSLENDPGAATRVSPLFPVWLSVLMRVAGEDLPIWLPGLFNALFRACGVVLVYLLANRYFGVQAAWWAALLYLVDPWESFWVGFILKESLAVPLFLLTLWALMKVMDRPSLLRAFFAGGVLGLTVLVRFANGGLWFAAGLLLVVLPLFSSSNRLRIWRQGVFAFLAFNAGMLLILSPWLVFTWQRTGQPVISTEFVGRYLYTSNAPGIELRTDGYSSAEGMDRQVLSRADRELKPLQKETHLFSLTLNHIRQNPGEWLNRVRTKMVNMWQPTFGQASLRNRLVLGLPYIVLMLLCLLGLFPAFYNRITCPVLWIPLVVFFCLHLIYWSEIRNRQYLTPILFTFGGLSLDRILNRRKNLPL